MIQVLFNSDRSLVNEILRKALKDFWPNKNEFNFNDFDLMDVPLSEATKSLEFVPLFEDKKVVIFRNAFFLEKKNAKYLKGDSPKSFITYLQTPNEVCDLYILAYIDDINTKNEVYTALKKAGADFRQVAPFSGENAVNYAEKYFAREKIPFDYKAIQELTERCDKNFGMFQNECRKLVNYLQGDKLTYEVVDSLVPRKIEDVSFKIGNLLMKGDKKGAIEVYEDLKKRNIEPLMLSRTLTSQFLFQSQVNQLASKRWDMNAIATELNCNYYRVKIAMQNRYILNKKMDRVFEALYKLEKNILTGESKPDTAFTLFLLNFPL